MSFRQEDGVNSLCQKALHIVTELCFAGQVEWEKCSGIFPRGGQTEGGTGNRCRDRAPRLVPAAYLGREGVGAGSSRLPPASRSRLRAPHAPRARGAPTHEGATPTALLGLAELGCPASPAGLGSRRGSSAWTRRTPGTRGLPGALEWSVSPPRRGNFRLQPVQRWRAFQPPNTAG